MTVHQAADDADGRARNRRWVWWPASFLVFALALLAGHRDAIDAKLEGPYWIAVWALGLFYAIAAAVFASRYLRRTWRRWTVLRTKAHNHDKLDLDLKRWKVAAAEATVRAEDAERRVASWHLDTLEEGRRRLLTEARASLSQTSFSNLDCAEAGDELLIGARWTGDMPLVDARYVLRSTTLKDIKAVLELQAIGEDRTVVFRVDSVKSSTYRSSLISYAHGERAFPSEVEIVPRDEADLGKEALWPEN